MSYSFNISLSVLNHLWRNLYRNFITVLWEAISNSWDADAKNVWINIDRENWTFSIKDDGIGMNSTDFQEKFLKVGHSKRKESQRSPWWRPYIWRKWIGKLALLSCSDRIAIITKKKWEDTVSWVIDNSELDHAITEDESIYHLQNIDNFSIEDDLGDLEHGTLLFFQWLKEEIHNTLSFLRKMIALYFRFSLIDSNFKIYLNDSEISSIDLSELSNNTQFVWEINSPTDSYLAKLSPQRRGEISNSTWIKGFIASVNKPTDLKIYGTGERITIDLYVNWRLREKNILKHIPTARITESYLYGQIHFDLLDQPGNEDVFTSSREWIIESNQLYQLLLNELKKILKQHILLERDQRRLELNLDWDEEESRVPKRERKSRSLFNEIASEYKTPSNNNSIEPSAQIPLEDRISQLSIEAGFNVPSYIECFLSENLLRKYIRDHKSVISDESIEKSKLWKSKEEENKNRGNIPICIRQVNDVLSYLDMDHLCDNITPRQNTPWKNHDYLGLQSDWKAYKPLRDAVGHTALLTEEAKRRLTTVYDSIKAKIKNLLLDWL